MVLSRRVNTRKKGRPDIRCRLFASQQRPGRGVPTAQITLHGVPAQAAADRTCGEEDHSSLSRVGRRRSARRPDTGRRSSARRGRRGSLALALRGAGGGGLLEVFGEVVTAGGRGEDVLGEDGQREFNELVCPQRG